jgi:hypothetical protein
LTTNFYQILGLPRSASPDAIKQAYRKLALQYHPDKNPNNKNAAEWFLKIQEAYETLSDENKKSRYDRNERAGFFEEGHEKIQHYFKAHCNQSNVKLNEEFEITYTYTGEGRNFIRPAFTNFFMAAKPIVSSRKVIIDGIEVKETSLIYTLAPLVNGKLFINSARIKIHQKPFQSPELFIHVAPNHCFFLKGKIADGRPLIFALNYEEVVTGQYYKTTRIQQHEVLIPRSKQAQRIQIFGEVLKYLTIIWIVMLAIRTGYGFISGFVGGGLLGSANVELFYKLMGLNSKMFDAMHYETVKKYLAQGYYLKNRLNNRPTFSKALYFIESIFI